MAKRDIDATITGMENLKPGDGVQVGDTKYEYGASLQTEGTPLIDPGKGKTVSIRVFHFKMDPAKVKDFPIDKQEVFNAHATQIKHILWGDGLIPLEGVSPRVRINKRMKYYNIFVPCEARLGVSWIEKPKNLTELLAKGKLESKKH